MPERLVFNPAQCTQDGKSFALWRLPHQTDVKVVITENIQKFLPKLLAENRTGFAFVPFDIQKDTSYFIEGTINSNPDIGTKTTVNDFYLFDDEITTETNINYKNNVTLAVEEIKNGIMKKVVLARNSIWDLPVDFCPLTFFNTLCQKYPEAMVSLVSIKGLGTWIGATPELLLSVTDDLLMTVALAGTRVKNSPQWGEKESEEQLWVLRYIENILTEYQTTRVNVSPRKHIFNGALEHLYTEVTFKKDGMTNTELASHLLHRLHPTPAVGGLEKQTAIDFIHKHEAFKRSYYAGFLGEMNPNKALFYVNLRCMQLLQNTIIGYAGAGITEGSDPEKELQETENKMNNLKLILN